MSSVKAIVRDSKCICALAMLFLGAASTFAQSTDETHPTPATYPITGNLGAGTYYYSAPANAGLGKMILEFRAPAGGGGMSVSLSGPDCCPSEGYVGADTGLPDPVTRQTEFNIPSRQTLLVTVYVAVAPGGTVRFTLNLAGTIGEVIGATAPTVCTDLAVLGFTLSTSGTTRTISGRVDNRSATDFRSTADRQWIEVLDIAKTTIAPVVVQRIPFTEVAARRRLPYTATHTTTSTLTPRYKVRIVYSPANATDSLTTNDDCNRANNETLQRVAVTISDS